jgi:hypothetical protein
LCLFLFWKLLIAKSSQAKLKTLEPILISFEIMGYFTVVRLKLFAKLNIELILISFNIIYIYSLDVWARHHKIVAPCFYLEPVLISKRIKESVRA